MRLKRLPLGLCLVLVMLFGASPVPAKPLPGAVPHWVQDLPIPQDQDLYLVIKGTYPSLQRAREIQAFIKQLMGTTPPDRVDRTDKYGVHSGPYLVGMLFDSRERAQWWIDFSYRNRTLPKGKIRKVRVKGKSELPYMPDAMLGGKKRLLTQAEVLQQVKAIPDIQKLAARKKLIYKFTDFPRNGDLRYEVEVLEVRQGKDPLMVDFIMVSAMNGEITERLSHHFRKDILKEH